MVLGLAGALAAAVLYGVGTVLQAIGVRRAAAAGSRGTWARVWAARLYGLGLLLDGLGFLASLGALRTLPLFVVESAVASSVAVTAVLAVRVLGARLTRGEVLALAAVAAGLVLLAAGARGGPGTPLSGPGTALLLVGLLPVAAVGVAGLFRLGGPGHVWLAVAAGLGFGGTGIAARVLVVPAVWWQLILSPVVWALAGYAVLALAGYALALARGPVTTVAAVTFTVETVAPAVVGLAWLGDQVRTGWTVPVAGAFALTVAGCVRLAGRSAGG